MDHKIRVLQIGTEMTWRGGENQVRYLMQGLAREGYECHLAYPKNSLAIERMAGSPEFPQLVLPSRKAWDPRSVHRLTRYCKSNAIELIDAHSSGGHALALKVKRRLPKIKVIVHRRVDNVPADNMFTRAKYFDSRVDRFVAISDAIRRVLEDYGVPPKKISVVRSATDGSRFQSSDRSSIRQSWLKKLNLLSDTVLIGNASALTAQKGYEVLIASLPKIKDAGLPFHCIIAGDGKLRESLESQVHTLGLKSHVTFLGFIEDVDSLLLGLDILCVPSNNEGLGTIILDGILAGCAIVATAVGGIPEIVHHGRTGLISPKGDVMAFSRNLATAIGSEGLRASLVRGGQAHVESEFSLNAMVQGNLRIYSHLLGTQCP